MSLWLPTLLIIGMLLFFELIFYVLFLLIKALKIYIRNNSEANVGSSNKEVRLDTKKTVRKFILGNVLVCIFIIALSVYQRNIDIYNNDHVIHCESISDAERFTELLEDNNLDYKVLNDKKRVKLKSDDDLSTAIHLLDENTISYSYIISGN